MFSTELAKSNRLLKILTVIILIYVEICFYDQRLSKRFRVKKQQVTEKWKEIV